VVRRTAEQVFIPLTVGGGVRTVDDVDRLLRAGADKVGINTAAISRPDLIADIADRFGSQVLVLSADVRRRRGESGPAAGEFEVTTHGGRQGAGPGRDRVVRAGGRAGRRGDPAQLDGRRRHQERL
jgi:cyclase